MLLFYNLTKGMEWDCPKKIDQGKFGWGFEAANGVFSMVLTIRRLLLNLQKDFCQYSQEVKPPPMVRLN